MYPTCDRGDNDRRAMLVAYIVGNDKYGLVPPCSEPITGFSSA